MVGIVIVAHSHKLAQGIKELADQVAGGRVRIAAAGGLDDNVLGTNVQRVLDGISTAYDPDGVVILMDLGSAVMTAEMAVEALPEERSRRVVLCPAPLVEGAVAAAAQAALGAPLAEVDAAARAAVTLTKVSREAPGHPGGVPGLAPAQGEPQGMVLRVRGRMGLHARPAAQFVKTASGFTSAITVRNLTRGGPSANAKSIIEVLGLGVECGHTISVSAEGKDRVQALDALRELVERGE